MFSVWGFEFTDLGFRVLSERSGVQELGVQELGV